VLCAQGFQPLTGGAPQHSASAIADTAKALNSAGLIRPPFAAARSTPADDGWVGRWRGAVPAGRCGAFSRVVSRGPLSAPCRGRTRKRTAGALPAYRRPRSRTDPAPCPTSGWGWRSSTRWRGHLEVTRTWRPDVDPATVALPCGFPACTERLRSWSTKHPTPTPVVTLSMTSRSMSTSVCGTPKRQHGRPPRSSS
jgi:hypothetical protein